MPSEKLYREFQNLERKIQLVLNENKRLKDELDLSNEENGSLKTKIKSYEANLNSFQNRMDVNKLANSMIVGEEGSAKLKESIEGYIKEIDKCIAHLAE